MSDSIDVNQLYKKCTQCPRRCGADRTTGTGFCQENDKLRVAWAGLHFGEEPVITVKGGSGTIFFTGCTLRCAFCQNYQISQNGMGREITAEEFASMCLDLQEKGAENINLITGSHHIPKIAEGIRLAKKKGVKIPFAWNSSAYESVENLELLKDLVTIWLPDLKTLNAGLSKNLFAAPDYPEAAKKAVKWMLDNFPMKLDGDKMNQGVIIRHLFLPGRFEETVDVLGWLKENADGRGVISLMSQYTPVPFKESDEDLARRKNALSTIENRLVSLQENEDLEDIIDAYDFEFLYYQELTTDTDWLPDFNNTVPFPNNLAKKSWHWKE